MSENTANPDLLSVSDVARELCLTPQRIRQILSSGQLEGRRVGSTWIISADAMDRFRLDNGRGTHLPHIDDRRTDHQGMKVLSFFSGAMGLDQGLEAAGMQSVLACEFDRSSRETIKHNRPDLPVLGDIWQYKASEIREIAGLKAGDEIDVIAGGPPCQSFSTAGARRGFDDVRGNVFLHYIGLIRELQPRYAILENVRGLLSMPLAVAAPGEEIDPLAKGLEGNRAGAILFAVRLLEEAGYAVSFNLYNAANYGSAQVRERVVLICSKAGGRVPYLPPTHSNDPKYGLPTWRTFRDAVEGLNPEEGMALSFPEKRLKYFRLLGPGEYWKHLPEDLQKEALGKSFYLGGGKTGFLRRLGWDKPAPTLVTHPAMPATDLGHPQLDRPLSIEEYKRVQDFPDSWELKGKLQDQYKQIGNAVPLRLGAAIGKAIVRHSEGDSWEDIPGFPYSRYKRTGYEDLVSSPPRLF
ncbi:MAG: DNA cytosine methyltransferase [Rhodoglobus sp.]